MNTLPKIGLINKTKSVFENTNKVGGFGESNQRNKRRKFIQICNIRCEKRNVAMDRKEVNSIYK